MKLLRAAAILMCLLLFSGGAGGSDHDETVPYYRTGAFNAPILEGWTNRSGADFAQFELAEAKALIRTALAPAADGLAAARAEMRDLLGREIGQPVYDDKVNLADGTWRVLVFDVDEATITKRRRCHMARRGAMPDTSDAADPELARAVMAGDEISSSVLNLDPASRTLSCNDDLAQAWRRGRLESERHAGGS